MYAQEKGPVSLAGHPTPTTSPSPEKSWSTYAPLSPFLQAVVGGVLGAGITILAVTAPYAVHVIAGWLSRAASSWGLTPA
jgi:hypothetical protein